jgi:hypothetical protein
VEANNAAGPVCHVIAQHDDLLIGTNKQIAHFEALLAPTRLHVADGATHIDILDNACQEYVNEAQVLFVQDVLAGRVVASPALA